MSQPEQPPPPANTLAGTIVLIVLGLLVLVPSGLCTGVMVGGAVWSMFDSPSSGGEALSIVLPAIILGGPFIVGGFAMLWTGIKRIRARRQSRT
ncbi:MAG: hypothetical protein JO348_15350 [Alphaproteobacteria bacterium]|nr:hypothetical protein [Alphaproteobacteria bacterium]MBV9541837.1 hypothetical protein [Alphaproteobacteria bacterium]